MGENSNYRNMKEPIKDNGFFSEEKKKCKVLNYRKSERLVLEHALVIFFQNQTSLTGLINQIL